MKHMKRVLSLLLCAVMVLGMLPAVAASAADYTVYTDVPDIMSLKNMTYAEITDLEFDELEHSLSYGDISDQYYSGGSYVIEIKGAALVGYYKGFRYDIQFADAKYVQTGLPSKTKIDCVENADSVQPSYIKITSDDADDGCTVPGFEAVNMLTEQEDLLKYLVSKDYVDAQGIYWENDELGRYYAFSTDGEDTVQLAYGSGEPWLFSTAVWSSGSDDVAVMKVYMFPTEMTLKVGETGNLAVITWPVNATNQNMTYESDDTSVATVSADGVVTAVGVGECTITVTTEDGEKTDTTEVTVEEAGEPIAVESVSLDLDSATVGAGEQTKLTATVSPSNATNQAVLWTSSSMVNAVVVDGEVTGLQVVKGEGSTPGTVTITATTVDGEYKASADVTVLFSDVMNDGIYYYEPVYWAYNNDITTGRRGGLKFDPDATCTRAEIVTFLWRDAGKPEPEASECEFADVTADKYYYKAVQWAYEQGITTGRSGSDADGNKNFDPNATCTRREIVTFLWRYAGKPEPESTGTFTDVRNSSAYYYKAVYWAAEKGITTGKRATNYKTFDPLGECTRAMSVTFIYRYEQ